MPRPVAERPKFSLVQRGAYFYVRFWWRGAHVRMTTGCTEREVALEVMEAFAANFDPREWSSQARRRSGDRPHRGVATIGLQIRNNEIPLRSEISIAESANEVPLGCGIYFLLRAGKIVYVGQAVNVFRRIGDHVGNKNFDSWSWIKTPKHLLDATERKYINEFCPELNSDFHTRKQRCLPFGV